MYITCQELSLVYTSNSSDATSSKFPIEIVGAASSRPASDVVITSLSFAARAPLSLFTKRNLQTRVLCCQCYLTSLVLTILNSPMDVGGILMWEYLMHVTLIA